MMPQPSIGDIYIGTAGYNYQHWRHNNNNKNPLYPNGLPQKQELRHYSGIFSAVEINNTFHGIPKAESMRGWVKDAKDGFCFSLKAPQDITHVHKLGGSGSMAETLAVFLQRVREGFGLDDNDDKLKNYHQNHHNGATLGPLLFQLPPSLHRDVDKIHALAELIPKDLSDITKIAFEFRNASWYCPEVYQVLRRYGFAVCENIAPDNSTLRVNHGSSNQNDNENGTAIKEAETASTWYYIRFHKRADRGVTYYTDEQLQKEATIIADRAKRGITQFIYFLNDHEGNGPKNAQSLMKFTHQKLYEQEGSIGPQTNSLVKDWKPDPVILKGGKGSIQSMFAKVAENKNKSKSNSVVGLSSFSSPRNSTTSTTQRIELPQQKSIKAMFADSDSQNDALLLNEDDILYLQQEQHAFNHFRRKSSTNDSIEKKKKTIQSFFNAPNDTATSINNTVKKNNEYGAHSSDDPSVSNKKRTNPMTNTLLEKTPPSIHTHSSKKPKGEIPKEVKLKKGATLFDFFGNATY